MSKTKLPATYEAACKRLKRNPKVMPKVLGLTPSMRRFHIANHKLATIAEAIQDILKFVPDYANENQIKYFCRFRHNGKSGKKPAFVFAYAFYYWTDTNTGVGSRFCFPDDATTTYFGKKFIKLHNDVLLK